MPVTEGGIHNPFGTVQAGALITMTLPLVRVLGPEIFDTDFTSEVFTDALRSRDISTSMDGKGRWTDPSSGF